MPARPTHGHRTEPGHTATHVDRPAAVEGPVDEQVAWAVAGGNGREPLTPDDLRVRIQALITWFEQLSPDRLGDIDQWYTTDARFKDPFHEVTGTVAIAGIFRHMFDTLVQPHFVVREVLQDGSRCCLVWDFRFRWRGAGLDAWQTIHGSSVLQLAADGRVCVHRDYWDAAEELYERLPIVGRLMRWLKGKMGAPLSST